MRKKAVEKQECSSKKSAEVKKETTVGKDVGGKWFRQRGLGCILWAGLPKCEVGGQLWLVLNGR